jgi:phenylpropionate dioxygenase-like ring-hydroxylating dioxygenase large terminal subunit
MSLPLPEKFPALRNQWFIACQTHKLRKKPLASFLMGMPIVLFRDALGHPRALLDRCPHRNIPLSKGKIQQGVIECPYHGWQFDGRGICQHIPGLLRESPVLSYSVSSFPVLEQDGFIWVNITPDQSAEAVLPYSPPLLNDPKYTSFIWEVAIEADLLNALENFLDGTHTHFIHPGLIRSNNNRSLLTAIIRVTQQSVEVEYTDEKQQSGIIAKLFDRCRSKSYGRFRLPSTAQLEYCSTSGTKMLITVFLTPKNDTQHKAYIITTYQKNFFPGWLSHSLIKPLFYLALQQDLHILKLQSKNIALFDSEDFHSTEIDLIRTSVRQILHQIPHQADLKKSITINL